MSRLLKQIISFSPIHLKIFFATSIAIFMVVALQLIGVRISKIALPIPVKPDTFFDTVIPKLARYTHSYRLKEDTEFIPKAEASGDYEGAYAYGVIDYETGEVLVSKNLSKQFPIASITKVMTAVVALDLADQEESFKVSQKASSMIPTKIGVRVGEELTLRELLHAALLTSANDAVEVISEGIDAKYGEKIFVRAMNEKADILGLKDTSFSNPQGFDADNHYSSIKDIALMTHYALKNYPLIKEIVKKDYELLPENISHKRFDLYNWNGLIGVYPDVTGVKIGNTDRALKTTVVVSERSGKKLLAVLLGAPGIIERDLWVSQILDLGYRKSIGLSEINITEDKLREKYQTWKY